MLSSTQPTLHSLFIMNPFSFVSLVIVMFSMQSSKGAFAFCHLSSRPSPTHYCASLLSMKMASNSPTGKGSGEIRYLGSGEDAIIRPGVVLVAPNHEYDHFLMRSAVFVYAIGLDEDESTIIRGVVIDHPTAFTIGEMSPNIMGNLADNQLFRGGYDGSDTAMLLHSAGGSGGPVKSDTMIGSSGVFEGGIVSAMESADTGVIEPNRCKFFFNHMQFTEKELDDMFSGAEDGDAWVSLEIPAEYVLNSDYDRGQLWYRLRNNIRVMRGRQ
mmetsp:Transcript_39412/g.94803  ORF Transcript_39412/g.94803 Transcript_39412/m.94803 type:complete len:270 (+) Transcript_39412:81-890(+)